MLKVPADKMNQLKQNVDKVNHCLIFRHDYPVPESKSDFNNLKLGINGLRNIIVIIVKVLKMIWDSLPDTNEKLLNDCNNNTHVYCL